MYFTSHVVGDDVLSLYFILITHQSCFSCGINLQSIFQWCISNVPFMGSDQPAHKQQNGSPSNVSLLLWFHFTYLYLPSQLYTKAYCYRPVEHCNLQVVVNLSLNWNLNSMHLCLQELFNFTNTQGMLAKLFLKCGYMHILFEESSGILTYPT